MLTIVWGLLRRDVEKKETKLDDLVSSLEWGEREKLLYQLILRLSLKEKLFNERIGFINNIV